MRGFLASQRSIAFRLCSDGEEVTIGVGSTDSALSPSLARCVAAALRGPLPAEVAPNFARLEFPSFGCVLGIPRTADSIVSRWRGFGPADLLLASLRGRPFALSVFATPAPRDDMQRSLDGLRAEAERLDREYLALPQRDVHRVARRRRERLDGMITRLERGLVTGMWRSSILVASDVPATTLQILGVLCGCLEDTPERLLLPLRFALCESEEPDASIHANLLRSDELASFLLLPARDRMGFALREEPLFDVDVPRRQGIRLGQILDGEAKTGRDLQVPLGMLTRHALVTGHTGFGKTTFVHQILRELCRERVPFLVLEPAKAEYRGLAGQLVDLCVFPVGRPPGPGEIPFQFNPFWFPAGYSLHTHLDLLRNAFTASFGLVPPGPYLLESALLRAYETRGWNLATGEHPNGHQSLSFPTLSDLIQEIDPVVDEAGYDLEVSRNLRAALKTRIGNLCVGQKAVALDTRENIPDKLLYEAPVVLELKHLGSDAEKAFLMSLVLIRLYEVRDVQGPQPGPETLRHLLVIEEAHRLLRSQRERPAEDGNMAYEAVRGFENLVSEVRAFSQGVMLVDQIPAAISRGAVKATGLKAIYHLIARDDREAVGDALSEEQRNALVRLPIGQAVVHAEGMDGPVRIRVPRPAPLTPISAQDLSDRVKRSVAVDPGTRDRLERAARRAHHSTHLRAPEIVRAADAVLLAAAGGGSLQGTSKQLRARISIRILAGAGGRRLAPKPRERLQRELAQLALDDALVRRALYHGWGDQDVDPLRRLLHRSCAAISDLLPTALRRGAGPHEWCAGCPRPCHFGYEGSALAQSRRFLDEIARIEEQPSRDWLPILEDAAAAAIRREFGPGLGPPSPPLLACAAGHALERLGLSPPAVADLIGPLADPAIEGDDS